MLAAGYRDGLFLLLSAVANLITNLSMNLFLSSAGHTALLIAAAESAVVLSEYMMYARALGGGKKLFAVTFSANLISFLAGLIVMPFQDSLQFFS